LIFIGFIGVRIVVQPGSDASPALLWAVAAGTFYGAFLTSSRWLSHLGSPIALSFTQLFIAALILTPFGLTTLPTFTPYVVSITFLSGLGSMLGNLLLLYAYSAAPATRLAPFVYFQLFAAVLFGWFVFDTWPEMWTWIGLFIVMAAGITSARLRA
jgi:drug/metabolite transporter (DMT)-like permease